MMKNKKLKQTDPLAELLKEELMDVPSAEFSDKLLHASMTSYRISYSVKYRKEELLGKVIIAIIVFLNLMILYLLKPFAVNPIGVLTCLPFVIGLGILIRMNMRVATKSY